MPILIKILFLTTTLWSAVYSASYAVCQIKKRSVLPALITIFLTLFMLAISAFSIFRL